MQASTYFPKVRRMLLCLAPFNLIHFWPASTLLRGHLALAILSPPETDPQILERWRCVDEVHIWANISERRILVSNFSVTCNGLREFYTLDWFLHVWPLPENRLGRLHVLKYTTQLPCIRWLTSSRSSFQLMTGVTVDISSSRSVVTFVTVNNRLPYVFMPIILLQHGYCTFVTILLRPFTRLFINLTVCIRSLFPKPATTLGLVEQAFWRVPLFTEWVVASSFKVILAKPSILLPLGLLPLGTSGSRCFSLILLHERIWRRIRLCHFPRLLIIVAETTIVSSRTLPVEHPLPTIPLDFFVHAVSSQDSWPRRFSHNFPFLAPKFLFRISCSILLFTIVFNLW